MSVINKMLKDLDQQSANTADSEQANLSYQKITVPETKVRFNKATVAGGVVGLVGVVAGVVGWLQGQSEASSQSVTHVTPSLIEAEKPSINTVVVEGVGVDDTVGDLNKSHRSLPSKTTSVNALSNVSTHAEIEPEGKGTKQASTEGEAVSVQDTAPESLYQEDSIQKSSMSAQPNVEANQYDDTGNAVMSSNHVERRDNIEGFGRKSLAAQHAASTPDRNASELTHFSKTPSSKSKADLAKKAFQKGSDAYIRGRSALAESEFKKALALQPEMHEARAQWVGLLFGEQSYQKAMTVLQQGMAQFPENTGYRLLAARIWLELNETDTALSVLVDHNPTERINEFLQLRAALAQQVESWHVALASWQQLLLNNKPQGKWLLGAAIAFERLGKVTEAKRHYRQALERGGMGNASMKYIKQRLTVLGA